MTVPTPRVDPQELARWLEGDREVVVLDPLSAERFEARHVPGARSACVYEVSFPEQVTALDLDPADTVVVTGANDETRDAEVAAAKLARLGFEDVRLLEGGVSAWRAAGLPLEGTGEEGAEPGAPLPVPEGRWRLDPEESRLAWVGRNPNGSHHGTVALAGGELVVSEGGATGSFEVDLTRIENLDIEDDDLRQVLIDHLASDDFFFVERHPEATYRIEAIVPEGDASPATPNARVEGSLELRGVTRELSFPATVARRPDGGLAAEAHFDVDRTDWDVIYGSDRFFESLGKHLVYDPISLDLRIVVRRESS